MLGEGFVTKFPTPAELIALAEAGVDPEMYLKEVVFQLRREEALLQAQYNERGHLNDQEETKKLRSFYQLPNDAPEDTVWSYHRTAQEQGADLHIAGIKVLSGTSIKLTNLMSGLDSSAAAFINDWISSSKRNKGRTL